MRVLIVNQAFYPDVVATAQHCHDLARALVARGHEVHVVASRSLYGEAGRSLPPEEVVDSIRIHRVAGNLFGRVGLAGRAVDFLRFYVAAAYRCFRIGRMDVAVFLTTPPFVSLLGIVLRALRGTRLVYWVMDLYPDVAVAGGVLRPESLVTGALERINRLCLSRADRTVVLGRCMEERVLAKGVAGRALQRINVWSDEDELCPIPRIENPFRQAWDVGDRTLVMYAGNFGIGHDVETIAEGVRLLAAEHDIRFAFVGGGSRKPELVAALRRAGVEGFIEAGYQPREKLGALLSSADIHLATMRPGWEGVMVPSKFYGTMAAGRPIVWVGGRESEVAKVIAEEGCGHVVSPGDASGFAAAIRSLASDPATRQRMGLLGRDALQREWGARHAIAKWADLIESLDPNRIAGAAR